MSAADAVLPGATIGIIGGGQLGRMLALEARRMDYQVVVLDPDDTAPAAQVADHHIISELGDRGAMDDLASRCDVVTLEWENADVQAVDYLSDSVPVRPGANVLRVAQNRLLEKAEARRFGLGTAPHAAVSTPEELQKALDTIGLPGLLKTVGGGYDGKGQRRFETADEARAAFAELKQGGRDLIYEGWVDFACEVSVVTSRGIDGRMASFPVGENLHEKGILDVTIVPARVSPPIAERARECAERMAEGLDLVGVLGVEMFVTRDGEILINEIAPRPHNSGHYTWEACSVSQFEQQLRAVCGLPLATPSLLSPCTMANLLGHHMGSGRGLASVRDALALPSVSLHLYGKRDPRPNRKMGHITALGNDVSTAYDRAIEARRILESGL